MLILNETQACIHFDDIINKILTDITRTNHADNHGKLTYSLKPQHELSNYISSERYQDYTCIPSIFYLD